MGTDFIEPDLQVTKDSVLIAMHSHDLNETTDVASHQEFAAKLTSKTYGGATLTGWFVDDFTLEEIKTLRAKQRFPSRDSSYDGVFQVPSLEEVIVFLQTKLQDQRFAGRSVGLYPEIKIPAYYESKSVHPSQLLMNMLAKHNLPQASIPVLIQSFDATCLRTVKDMIKSLPAGQVRPKLVQLEIYNSSIPGGYLPGNLATVAEYADGIAPEKKLIVTEEADETGKPTVRVSDFVTDAHKVKLFVHPWVFRSDWKFLPAYARTPEKEYRVFLDAGVDGLFTDYTDAAVKSRQYYIDSLVIKNLQDKLDDCLQEPDDDGDDDDNDMVLSIRMLVRAILVIAVVAALAVITYMVIKRRRDRTGGAYRPLSTLDPESRQLQDIGDRS